MVDHPFALKKFTGQERLLATDVDELRRRQVILEQFMDRELSKKRERSELYRMVELLAARITRLEERMGIDGDVTGTDQES